jgi:LuxR family transcriptional regulator, maltose regulon positive regulatory protein
MPHARVMAKVKGEALTQFEVTSGVTLSRTVIPTLPPNYLSRKHLFHLLQHPAPHTTVVLAPAGYGKTSLVAQWANTHHDRVIWVTLTESDSLEEMAKIFIQATRNVIPGFAPWFDQEPGIRPVENVRRWGNELIATGKDYILVIDNLRQHTARDVDIAIKLIEQFPPNLQFITIRRDSIETVYATFSSRGPLAIVGKNELAFSESEIQALAGQYSLDLSNSNIASALNSAHGWPAATSMIAHQLSGSVAEIDFEKILASQSNPLRLLALSVLDSIPAPLRIKLQSLSVVDEFTHEQAQVILEDDYSYDEINRYAFDGNIFYQTGSPEVTFEFNSIFRELLLSELRADNFRKMRKHAKLMEFHENRNEPNLALEHAYLAKDFEKVGKLFPDAARILQATGKGRELIKWSIFAGDSSQLGLIKRSTVEIAGRLANLEFADVRNMADQMNLDAKGTALEGFISQLTHGARAYVDISQGKFEEFQEDFAIAMRPTADPLMLGVEEQLALHRLAATRAFIFGQTSELEKIYEEAKNLVISSKFSQTNLILMSINAMVQLEIGDYRRAYEVAQNCSFQFTKLGYVGIFGPLESLFVMARCEREFLQIRESEERFAQIKYLAQDWKQWHWYFLADGYLARGLALQGNARGAVDAINGMRAKASELPFAQGLETLIDLAELNVRYEIKDYDRLITIVERAPEVPQVQLIKLALARQAGKANAGELVSSLPDRTPREHIVKHLVMVGGVIDQERAALVEMKKALEIGSRVGAKEIFLRQSDEMANLILKIASESPTVYLEDLATCIAEKIKNRRAHSSDFSSSLTKRELEVLRHLSTERPISSIASTLHISHNTMKTHLKNLYRKMEVDGRIAAVEKAKANYIL